MSDVITDYYTRNVADFNASRFYELKT